MLLVTHVNQNVVVFRENELLKHQLKKYVGAVQMLRRGLEGHQSTDTTEGSGNNNKTEKKK